MNIQETGKFGLGITQLKAHAFDATPVVTLGFVNPDHRLPLPFPQGDWYLRQTAVPAIQPEEVVVSSTLIRGLLQHYKNLGLIPQRSHIIEVEPTVPRSPRRVPQYGFPATDALQTLTGQLEFTQEDGGLLLAHTNGRLVLTPTFTNDLVTEQASKVGLESLPRPDSVITNNKAEFRKKAEKYGYEVLPGQVLENWENISAVLKNHTAGSHGIWVKFPTGSGGDLVVHLDEVNKVSIHNGIRQIRQAVSQALKKGNFGISIDSLWPKNSISPIGLPLVIEEDVRNLGEVITNGSTQFVTHRSGDVDFVGHFKQITAENGEYLGNTTYYPDKEIDQLIKDHVAKVANYNIDANKFFGIQGEDWFLVRTPQGHVRIYGVELNARGTANTPPQVIANKLGARHWINTNVYTDTPIYDVEDYIRVVGEEFALGTVDTGLVIPQAFRTLVTRRRIYPSPNFKVVILGESDEHCDNVMEMLKRRNIRFQPEA